MIRIQRISTKDTELYNYMERLLIASFPEEEYRELSDMKIYTDTKPEFYNNIIFSDNKQVGFVTYWDLGDFYYVEHFAIDPEQRNGGYGRKLLNHLFETLDRPIALEVEYPNEEISKRRINFYKREGFELWEDEYYQPPYRPGFSDLPMYIMVYGNLERTKNFENIKSQIHRNVYNVSLA